VYFIDGHCDTLSKALDENKSLFKNDLQFSFDKANKLGGGVQVMACFIDTEFLTYNGAGFDRCNRIIKKFEDYQKENNCNILIKNKYDLQSAIQSNETKVILSIENGSAISGNLDNIDYFYNKGVRIMSVTWNDDNELGCGAKTKDDKGLTYLGVQYVKKLNDLGAIVDVSHLSEKGFWDTIEASKSPVVATHSNVYELCKNSRNLKDNQIKAIAKSGGIIGICYYSNFLNSKRPADVKDIVEHIKYIKNLVGIDHVGLGSDFDGMDISKTARNVDNISMIKNITKELKLQGFKCEEIVKIMWNNWSDILKKII